MYRYHLLPLLGDQINSLQGECNLLKINVGKLCRKLNQCVQRNLCEQKYDKLIQTIEEFIKNYPLCILAQKAVTMVKKIIPYCYGGLLNFIIMKCEMLQLMTSDYHDITSLTLPLITLLIKQHKQITSSLHNGSPDIKLTYHYFMSDQCSEELELVNDNHLIKLQEVAPNYVKGTALQQKHITYMH